MNSKFVKIRQEFSKLAILLHNVNYGSIVDNVDVESVASEKKSVETKMKKKIIPFVHSIQVYYSIFIKYYGSQCWLIYFVVRIDVVNLYTLLDLS